MEYKKIVIITKSDLENNIKIGTKAQYSVIVYYNNNVR